MKTVLEPEVLDWLQRNLLIERPRVLIRDKLRSQRYSDDAIREAMGASYPEEVDFLSKITDYHRLAEPRLVRHPNNVHAKQLEGEKLQLYVIDNFFNLAECECLIKLSGEHCKPSKVKGGMVTLGRTSSTSNLYEHMSDSVAAANEKISNTLGIGKGYCEPLQAQIYSTQQEYQPHYDFFPEARLREAKKEFALSGQRCWTFMIYLKDVRRGGETRFPRVGKSIAPSAGKAVIWNNLDENGKPVLESLHQGCPVEKGTKIILTRWFRTQGYGPSLLDD